MNMDVNTLLLFGIAVAQMLTAFFAWHTSKTAMATKIVAERTELNTNSMREQLVLKTGEAEHARGREEARVEGEEKAEKVADKVRIATDDLPLPVADDRVAKATEQMAEATKKMADVAEKGAKK